MGPHGARGGYMPAVYWVWTDRTSSLQQTPFVAEETEPQELTHLLKATQLVPWLEVTDHSGK